MSKDFTPTPNKAMALPIDPFLPVIAKTLQGCSRLIIDAEPGSGKTTRVPTALLGDSSSEIWVLEPRRLAAKLAAQFVAKELGEQAGGRVGYEFRFERIVGAKTRIRFLTEGLLTRKLLANPKLEGVGVVILDEFHERNIHTDVALAMLLRLQENSRPDLRIVLMSATIDAESITKRFGKFEALKVPGKTFEVTVEYSTFQDRLEGQVAQAVRQLFSGNRSREEIGHVLVFLPGMREIRRAEESLASLARSNEFETVILHGDLTAAEQDRALKTSKKTKVILSTNVAESSVTLDGVRTVIDAGLAKQAQFSVGSGLPRLVTKAVSRASCIQRAGRAGRQAPGKCVRLFSRGEFEGRALFEKPEILRADLTQTLLELKALGVNGLAELPFLDPPTQAQAEGASQLLLRLGALNGDGSLTIEGKLLAELGVHPRLGKLVLQMAHFGFGAQGCRLAAEISEGEIEGPDVLHPRSGRVPEVFSVRRLREQLESRLSKIKLPLAAKNYSFEEAAARSMLAAFPDRIAQRRGKGVESHSEVVLSGGGSAVIENLDATSKFLVALEADERLDKGTSKIIIRKFCVIDPAWLFELEPFWVVEKEVSEWDPKTEKLQSTLQFKYDELVLSEEKAQPRDLKAAASVLAKQAFSKGLHSIWDLDAIERFIARVRFLKENRSDLELPEWNLERVVPEACEGILSFTALRQVDVINVLRQKLAPEQFFELERQAPEWVELPSKRRLKIQYEPGKPPWVESRLQDFFGMTRSPTILGGRVPLTLHLLAPNKRPVQVTSDLAGFWERAYPAIRKELSRRYPRHSWPENPLQKIS